MNDNLHAKFRKSGQATFRYFGQLLVNPISEVGRYSLFTGDALRKIFFPPMQRKLAFTQLDFVGNKSIGIIIMAAIMIGAVFGLQFGSIFRIFGAESMIGAAAGIGLAKELSPVVTSFLVAGRAGSSMAAEIATMRVNEQIDALRIMAVNPISYLVAPRVLATMIMLPLLTCIFTIWGVFSAFVVGVLLFNVDPGVFFEKIQEFAKLEYLVEGLQKAALFGVILASVSCFKGFHAKGGAKGVGQAVTSAVVISLVTILITDFFVSYIRYNF